MPKEPATLWEAKKGTQPKSSREGRRPAFRRYLRLSEFLFPYVGALGWLGPHLPARVKA